MRLARLTAFLLHKGKQIWKEYAKSLLIKVNACQLLEKEISMKMKREECSFIIISSSTDAWQQIEERYKLTRRMLKIIAR